MIHEFFIINEDEIPKEKGCQYELKLGKNIVEVHDDIIVNNPLFLKGFKSFKVSLKNPGEGLDYHGITIIPTISIQDFITNIIKARDLKIIPSDNFNDNIDIFKSAKKIKPKIYAQLGDLIMLCEQAIKDNKYIIHFGL